MDQVISLMIKVTYSLYLNINLPVLLHRIGDIIDGTNNLNFHLNIMTLVPIINT